jgi:hypothetical protein
MAIINFNSISGVSTISVASSITVGNNVSIGTDRVTATSFSGNLTGNVTGTVNSSGIATFSNGLVVSAGTTAAPSISPTGDSNTGIFFPSADTIAFAEGGVEAARFDSSGRLGIGTNNPSTEFEVFGTGTVASFRGTGGSGFISIKDEDDGTFGFIGVDGGSIKLQTSGSSYADKLVVDSSGRVTKPYQPYAIIGLSPGNTGAYNNKVGPGATTVVGTNIVSNNFSLYNSSNGRFTAPVTGLYEFGFSSNLYVNTASNWILFTTFKNGSVYTYHYSDKIASQWQYVAFSDKIVLNANDYVDLRLQTDTGTIGADVNEYTQINFRLIG